MDTISITIDKQKPRVNQQNQKNIIKFRHLLYIALPFRYAYAADNEQIANSETSSTESTAEIIIATKQYIETSTATVHDPRIERSVLYQMKSLGGNSLVSPLQLPATIKIIDVATNGSHFLAVTSGKEKKNFQFLYFICLTFHIYMSLTEGLVYSWGEGNSGQLGHGNTEIWKHYPSKIESIKKYKIIG